MDFNLFRNLIDQAREIPTIKQLGLSVGGEPLLHSSFIEMLHYATNPQWKLTFFSNGMLFSDKIAEAVVDLGVDGINFSLDGIGLKHENIRLGSRYEAVKTNILKLLEFRGNLKKPRVYVNLVQFNHTEQDIQDFLDEWVGIVDSVGISVYLDQIFQTDSRALFWRESATYNAKYCQSPFYYMAVLWNGLVVPCCHDIGGQHPIGDLRKDTLIDVWGSRAYRELRMHGIHVCKKCNVWKKLFVTKRYGNLEYSGTCKYYIKEVQEC